MITPCENVAECAMHQLSQQEICGECGQQRSVEDHVSCTKCRSADQNRNDFLAEECMRFLNESVLESLFEQGVSCTFLEVSAEKEARMWKTQTASTAIDPFVRCMMIRWMSSVASDLNLRSDAWYEMANILDIYCQRSSKDNLTDLLPLVCAAIVCIVQKLASGEAMADWLLVQLPKVSQWLLQQGHITSDQWSHEAVARMELEVLEALEWRVILPTVFTWSNSFMARFSVLSRQMFARSLSWIWQLSQAQMEFFVQSQAAQLLPRQLAIGLFTVGLASANLVPLSLVFPDEADEHRRFFLRRQQEGVANLRYVANDQQILLCKMLEFVTQASQSDIQQHCRDVVDALARFQHHHHTI